MADPGRISGIEAIRIAVPSPRRLFAVGDWIIVRVTTDEGLTGIGEASQSGDDGLLCRAIGDAAGRLQGRPAAAVNTISRELNAVDAGRVGATAASAIACALWDIRAQSVDLPLAELFGGRLAEDVRLYANINRGLGDRSPEGFARAAAGAVADGFDAIKAAPFDEVIGRGRPRSGTNAAWQTGVERMEAIRDAVGPGIEIAVDCHCRFEASEAVRVAQALEPIDLLWFEEPVPRNHPEQLRWVSERVPMTTAAGETFCDVEDFRPYLERRTTDVLMPDIKHCGGARSMMEIAAAARMHGVLIAPHCPSGPVSIVTTGQVASAMANFLILEYPWGEVPWRQGLLEPVEPIANGRLAVSTRPGIGHTLVEDALAEHRRDSV